MTDNTTAREMTFSEELPYFKEQMQEVFNNYHNPNGSEDPLHIAVLRHSSRIVRKAEEEITRQQAEIDSLRANLKRVCAERDAHIFTNNFIKSEAVKECLAKVENYSKTHCNPYGKPDFEYDTSIKILNFIDNLVKEIADEENVTV